MPRRIRVEKPTYTDFEVADRAIEKCQHAGLEFSAAACRDCIAEAVREFRVDEQYNRELAVSLNQD